MCMSVLYVCVCVHMCVCVCARVCDDMTVITVMYACSNRASAQLLCNLLMSCSKAPMFGIYNMKLAGNMVLYVKSRNEGRH